MSEFEMIIPVESSQYGDCVICQKYGDGYKLLAGKVSNKPDGTPYLRWVYPQTKDRQPSEKTIPLQISLGNLTEARAILTQILAALPGAPQGQNRGAALAPKGEDADGLIPF